MLVAAGAAVRASGCDTLWRGGRGGPLEGVDGADASTSDGEHADAGRDGDLRAGSAAEHDSGPLGARAASARHAAAMREAE